MAPLRTKLAKDAAKKKADPNKKSWKKPKDMPKRPLSAYNIFFQHQRKKIVRERFTEQDSTAPGELEEALKSGTGRPHRKIHGMIGFVPLARQIAADWKNLDPVEKEVFVAKASIEQDRYRLQLSVWRKKQEQKKIDEAAAVAQLEQEKLTMQAKEERQQQPQQTSQQQQQNSQQFPMFTLDGCAMEEFGNATFFPVDKPAGSLPASHQPNSLLGHVMAHNRAQMMANAAAAQNGNLRMSALPETVSSILGNSNSNGNSNFTNANSQSYQDLLASSLEVANGIGMDQLSSNNQSNNGSDKVPGQHEAIASMQTQLDQLVNQINFMISSIQEKSHPTNGGANHMNTASV